MLRDRWTIVPMADLVRALRSGRDVRGWVAITFDDGYEDNLRLALPALREAGLPATVFVVSDELGRRFWWDRLTNLWATRRGAPDTGEFFALHRRLRGTEPGARDRELDALASEPALAGTQTASGRPPRAMTDSEVAELAASGLVEIGAHTRNHPFLPDLTRERQEREIGGAKVVLEEVIGRPVPGMSYPYGGFDGASVVAAGKASFDYACAAAPGVCTTASPLLSLPRVTALDWSGDELDTHLRARSPGSARPGSRP